MVRKLVVVLLTMALTLGVMSLSLVAGEKIYSYATPQAYEEATGEKITEYNEAPQLKALVAAGELPPVEERLPEEPLVVSPEEEIGVYGGILRQVHAATEADTVVGISKVLHEFPLKHAPGLTGIYPNVIKGYEVSEDQTTFTLYLRKGMKWSDGHPFTADDWVFWYEAVALNESLSPAGIRTLKVTDEMGVVEKVDDYTVRFRFPEPYGYFEDRLTLFRPPPFAPKHYLEQFHPDYTAKAKLDKTVKEAGFTDWVGLFNAKRTWWAVINPDCPTIWAWNVVNDPTSPVSRLERNPYFWKVDTEGNQLPYLDGMERVLVTDPEAKLLKVIAGEVDFIYGEVIGFTAEKIATLEKYKEQGKYRILKMIGNVNNTGAVFFNFSSEDPVLRSIFQDKRFRIALSVGINRDEVNQIIFRGAYIPGQIRPDHGGPRDATLPHFHTWSQYDPQLANQLLDVMGLKWDKDHKIRLRPDGKPLNLVATVYTGHGPEIPEMAEMYKQYWNKIGVDIVIKPLPPALYNERLAANQHEIVIADIPFGGYAGGPTGARNNPSNRSWQYNPAWGQWFVSKGEEGEEPPEDVKRLYELSKLYLREGAEKRLAIEKEIEVIYTDNFWAFAGMQVSLDLFYSVWSNRTRNVTEPRSSWTWDTFPDTWFFKE